MRDINYLRVSGYFTIPRALTRRDRETLFRGKPDPYQRRARPLGPGIARHHIEEVMHVVSGKVFELRVDLVGQRESMRVAEGAVDR